MNLHSSSQSGGTDCDNLKSESFITSFVIGCTLISGSFKTLRLLPHCFESSSRMEDYSILRRPRKKSSSELETEVELSPDVVESEFHTRVHFSDSRRLCNENMLLFICVASAIGRVKKLWNCVVETRCTPRPRMFAGIATLFISSYISCLSRARTKSVRYTCLRG